MSTDDLVQAALDKAARIRAKVLKDDKVADERDSNHFPEQTHDGTPQPLAIKPHLKTASLG